MFGSIWLENKNGISYCLQKTHVSINHQNLMLLLSCSWIYGAIWNFTFLLCKIQKKMHKLECKLIKRGKKGRNKLNYQWHATCFLLQPGFQQCKRGTRTSVVDVFWKRALDIFIDYESWFARHDLCRVWGMFRILKVYTTILSELSIQSFLPHRVKQKVDLKILEK